MTSNLKLGYDKRRKECSDGAAGQRYAYQTGQVHRTFNAFEI